ncbi:MAG: TIGR02453 family protein, partial [Lutibacter sp.]|nr:TIGR02453 family protein [Lutibacter sp.]
LKEVTASFVAMRPYLDYMSDVLTTDLNGESLVG